MKPILIGLFVTVSLSASSQTENGIPFDNKSSWREINKIAADEGKYIFVDIYTTWCGPCKMMDQAVYKNDTVAELMKKHFISVKVQMDSTSSDNEHTRNWYKDARELAYKYKIAGYPSFLFFSPGGQLVLQDIGYKDVVKFVEMGNAAVNPERIRYTQLLQDYKTGVKDYPAMGQLATFAIDVGKDKDLAAIIAADYKENFLDTASEAEIATAKNLDFINRFSYLMNVNDRIFSLYVRKGTMIDSIVHFPGWADFHVRSTICRNEVVDKLVKNGTATNKNPNWKTLEDIIEKKYHLPDIRGMMYQQKLDYYRTYNTNWRLWADVIDEVHRFNPPVNDGGLGIFTSLNMPAWDAFLNCPDRSVLERALKWSDLSIKLEQPHPSIPYLDTRAQLLYKLGRVNEAKIQ